MLQVFFILLAIGCVTSAIKCYAGDFFRFFFQNYFQAIAENIIGNRLVFVRLYPIVSALNTNQEFRVTPAMVSIHFQFIYRHIIPGNSFSHLSLCSLFKTKVPANDYFYASKLFSSSKGMDSL